MHPGVVQRSLDLGEDAVVRAGEEDPDVVWAVLLGEEADEGRVDDLREGGRAGKGEGTGERRIEAKVSGREEEMREGRASRLRRSASALSVGRRGSRAR